MKAQSAARTLCLEDSGLAPPGSRALVLVLHALQHGGILKHVWQDQEADFAATNVDLLQLGHTAVAVRHCDVGHLWVITMAKKVNFPVHCTEAKLDSKRRSVLVKHPEFRDTQERAGD